MKDLFDVIGKVSMEGFCEQPSAFKQYDKGGPYYWDWESNVAKPALEALGFINVTFLDGERDNFGPLSRIVTAQKEELQKGLYMASLRDVMQLQRGDRVYIRGKSFLVALTPDRNPEGVLFLQGKKHLWKYRPTEEFAASIRSIIPVSKIRAFKEKKNYAFAESDGGKTIPSEQKDCTVRALALSTGVPYEVAHTYLKQYGRRDGAGFNIYRAYSECTLGGFRFTSEHINRLSTVGQLLKKGSLPSRCILQVSRHVIAVVNNVVQDTYKVGSSRKVLTLWRIEK